MKLNLFVILSFFLSIVCKAQDSRAPLFKSFDGTMIHYEVQGEGAPVILLHGFIGNSSGWKRGALPAELVKSGFKVILIDLRGNGLSDKPHDEDSYSNFAEVKDIIGLMKYLGFKKYDVVGYSRGSIIGAKLMTMDKNVHATVLGGMGTDFTNPDWPRRKMFEEAFSGQAHKHPQTAGAVKYAKSIGADTIVLGLLQKYQPSTSKADLAKVKIPVLVIAGKDDEDNGKATDLAKIFSNASFQTVEGNHDNASRSTEFAEAIAGFLKKNQ